MTGNLEEGISALKRMIARAEDLRVDTIIKIAFLEVDDESSSEAKSELARIEKLLEKMRKQQIFLTASAYPSGQTKRPTNMSRSAA